MQSVFHTTLNNRLGGVSDQVEAQDNGQEKEDKDGYIIIITKRQRIDRKRGLFIIVVEITWIT